MKQYRPITTKNLVIDGFFKFAVTDQSGKLILAAQYGAGLFVFNFIHFGIWQTRMDYPVRVCSIGRFILGNWHMVVFLPVCVGDYTSSHFSSL
ncbi:hypothetical protein [Lacrimispora xylanisolvens]|uniref:hypothetical protein n=1 Tax=Lacrimispora xylanisolvens TaxID=384636 RepID=UPI002402A33B